MSKADIISLVQEYCTDQGDVTALDKLYDEVILDLGIQDWLIQATLIPVDALTGVYAFPDDAIEQRITFYDDRILYKTMLSELESISALWRTHKGTPVAFMNEDQSSHEFRLYPVPEIPSKDFIFMFGSPLGLDYPEYALCMLHTQFRTDIPEWLNMPVAFEILAREFARESDHQDMMLSEVCRTVSGIMFGMVK